MSLPTRGAWIEMLIEDNSLLRILSLPTRGAWIEMVMALSITRISMSLPTRGAWIEIIGDKIAPSKEGVAPHTGSVD